MKTKPKFHWALPIDAKKNSNEAQRDTSGGIDLETLNRFVRVADESPIESLLTPFGFHMPDPIPLVGMLSQVSKRIKYLIAYRPGLMSPTLFAQQINTLTQLMPSRININIVAGFSPEELGYYGDYLDHDQRFNRSVEFLEIVSRLWKDSQPFDFRGAHYQVTNAQLKTRVIGAIPKVYLSGNSKVARSRAMEISDCWLRYGDRPEAIGDSISGVSNVGLRLSVVSGPTREVALERAAKVVANPDQEWRKFLAEFVSRCDSSAVKDTYQLGKSAEWISPFLWTGAVPYRGGPALAIVGSYREVADTISQFIDVGVSEFIFSGWPTDEELIRFSEHVHPLVRGA